MLDAEPIRKKENNNLFFFFFFQENLFLNLKYNTFMCDFVFGKRQNIHFLKRKKKKFYFMDNTKRVILFKKRDALSYVEINNKFSLLVESHFKL